MHDVAGDATSGESGELTRLSGDLRRAVNGRWWRYISVTLSPGFLAIATYRLERALYLRWPAVWPPARVALSPVLLILSAFSAALDLPYRADIGSGLSVLHPALGLVVSPHAVIGEHVVFVGGNCLGGSETMSPGDIRVGNHVVFGANAVVIGPCTIGDGAKIGAGAVVISDVPPGATAVGVPAKVIATATTSSIPGGR